MTSKKLFTGIAAAAFALVLSAGGAMAEEDSGAIKNSGLFLGGGVGMAFFDRYVADDGIEADLALSRKSEESAAYKLSAIWNLCEYGGLEIGYTKIDEGQDDQEPDGVTFSALPTYPLPWFNLSLLSRVGIIIATFGSGNNSETVTELTYGAGLGWQATDRISLRAEWERLDFEEAVDVVWLSAYFRVSNL